MNKKCSKSTQITRYFQLGFTRVFKPPFGYIGGFIIKNSAADLSAVQK